jgi:hypothetical protein
MQGWKPRKALANSRICKPMCKPDAVKRDEAGETELTSWTVLCRVRRGRCIWGRPLGTAETGVVRLITQRSQVQILPPLPSLQVKGLSRFRGAFLLCLVNEFVNEVGCDPGTKSPHLIS